IQDPEAATSKEEVAPEIEEPQVAPVVEEQQPQPLPEPEALAEPIQPSSQETPKAEETASTPPPQPLPAVRREPPKELKLAKKKEEVRFDSRDRQGLRDSDNEAWRKRRAFKPRKRFVPDAEIIRPKNLTIRLPITIKDLSQEMKLKASQLIAKLFMQGMTLTL